MDAFLPTSDVLFKRLLTTASHLHVPQGFIKDFFGVEVPTSAIKVRSPFEYVQVPKRGRAKKKFFHFIRDVSFDVQIASVTVEMQIQGQTDYLARAITYLTSLYESSVDISVKTPTRYGTAKPAWSMNILDHTMFGDDQRALRILTFKDEDGKEALVKTSPFGSSMFRVEADSGYLQPPLKLGFFELSKPAPTPNLAAW